MTIRIGEPTEPCSASEVTALEDVLTVPLPADYKAFVARHNGARPETNIFPVDPHNDSGVNQFIPFKQLSAARENLGDDLPVQVVPIAWAEGGNYVLLDARGGTVTFWDHEDPSQAFVLADSFTAFLGLLRPFDINSVELKPGQVKSVWVDPELLRVFGKQGPGGSEA